MNRQKERKSLDELVSQTIGGRILQFDFTAWKENHQQDIHEFKARMEERRIETPVPTDTWAIIVKSRITKLAAAAVIIIAAVIGLTYWLPSGKPEVKIPQELTEMPFEQLLEIHFGKVESSFATHVVAAAVGKAMDKLSSRQILAIGHKYGKGRGPVAMGCIASVQLDALSEMVEACDFFVHARVEQVDLDVSDLKAAIIHKQRNRLSVYSGAPVKTAVQLSVISAYPALPSNVGEKIRLSPVFSSGQIEALEEGKEYLIALGHEDGLFWLMKWKRGIYPVDPNGTVVPRLLRSAPKRLDEVWEFIMDAYDAIHEGTPPSAEVLDYWLAKLQSDDMADCLTAIEYFNTLPEPVAPQELVVDAIERFLSNQIIDSDPTDAVAANHRRDCFALETLELLIRVADEATVDRILALCQQKEFSLEGEQLVSNITVLALKHPGPQRRERFLLLLSQLSEPAPPSEEDWLERVRMKRMGVALEELGNAEGDDIDELLMDMLEDPNDFGILDIGRLRFVWEALARRGRPEIRDYLETLLADPENVDMGVKFVGGLSLRENLSFAVRALQTYALTTMPRKQALQYLVDLHEQGEISERPVIDMMVTHLQPEDTQFISFLRRVLPSDHRVAVLAAQVLPDPSFVPVLRAELEKDVEVEWFGELLSALFACGEEEQAVEMALAELERPVNDADPKAFLREYAKHGSIISFLGTTADESCLPVLEDFTREEVIRVYRQCAEHFDFPGRCGSRLRLSAIQAMGRLGPQAAIPRLKDLYRSDDIEIRMLAALSLYSLGDDTGLDLLGYFVNGAEQGLPQFYEMGGRWPWLDSFEPTVLYLRSARTDELLLESYASSHFHPRPDWPAEIGDGEYAFAKQYETELLPILVEQLNNKNRVTRKFVNALLKRLTGQDFGFEPAKFALQQTEVIERWWAYVDNYLAKSSDSPQ